MPWTVLNVNGNCLLFVIPLQMIYILHNKLYNPSFDVFAFYIKQKIYGLGKVKLKIK
jgi:hypothetical protein